MKGQIFILLLIAAAFMISCNKEADFVDDEYLLETRNLTNDCFEFVFPVSFQFPDNTVIVVNSTEELQALKSVEHGKVKLVFPVDIINSEGDIITVEDRLQMKQILEDCGITTQYGKGGKHGKGNNFGKAWNKNHKFNQGMDPLEKCFEIVFPLSVVFPDGTVTEFEDKDALHSAWSAFKQANPKTKAGPEFEFPIQIIMDGENDPIPVNSKEELQIIRKNC